MDLQLREYHVLITGANGDIGLQIAREYLSHGARVTLHYHTRRCQEFDALLAEYETSGKVCAVQAKAECEEDVIRAIEESVKRLGPIHILVLNHAIFESKDVPIWELSLAQWQRTIDVNLTGCFLFAREFCRQLKKAKESGDKIKFASIAIIGSTAGHFGEADHIDYASSKSALMFGFLRSLKNEIVRLIPTATCNVIAPGWVLTKMAEQSVAEGKHLKALRTTPLRKIATTDDVAKTVLIATSPVTGGHMTGNILKVDGGMEGRVLWESLE